MSFRSDIRNSLMNLSDDYAIVVRSRSEAVQARQVAKELGVEITTKATNDGQWIIRPKEKSSITMFKLNGDKSKGLYITRLKHWELKVTPVGASGVPRTQLAYYPQGHQDIPDDWIVFVEEYNMLFKPRYVLDPTDLLNDKLVSLGLQPTRFMVDTDYNPLSPDEAEKRFDFIRQRGKVDEVK